MPSVRKLEPDEVRVIENRGKGTRKLVEEQYDEFLREYVPGDYGEVDLEEGDVRLTVRNRLKAAATRRGMSLEFRRTKGPVLRFRVLNGAVASVEEEEPKPVALKPVAQKPVAPRPVSPPGPQRGPRRKNP